VIAVAIALGLGGAALALRLRPTAAASTLVSSSSRDYAETQRFYARFGEEPVEVLIKGDLQQLVLSSDLERLLGLEGCLSGNVPASALAQEGGARGPCGQLARARTVKVVFGPGTFVNEAANQIDEQLAAQTAQAQAQARQAERVVGQAALARGLSASEARALGRQAAQVTAGRFQEALATIALQYGLSARPSIGEHNFVSALVFDSSKPAGTPKQRFAYLFPSRDAALVSVRMRAGLSESRRTRTIGLIRQAVAMPQWRPAHGGSYLVTGEPVIVSDLTSSITRSIALLLVAVLLLMAGTLSLIFSGRPRLLPLGVAVLAAALTFAALSLAGGSLAMAQVAVLPVLVGLAVDYAIQFQARVHEAAAPGGERRRSEAIRAAAARGAPTIATAAAASAGAMLVLLLSPVPMVRGFGVLLVVGLGIALLCALTAGAAGLALARGTSPSRLAARRGVAGALASIAARLGPSWRGARELVLDNPVAALLRRAALVGAVRRPGRVLGVGLALAALGWGLDTQTRVETDITKLVPQNLGSLQNLGALERAAGVGGEIDLMVSGSGVVSPATIEWMSAYQSSVLRRFGYSAARGGGRPPPWPAALPCVLAAGPVRGAAAEHRRGRLLGAAQTHRGAGGRTAERDPAVLLPGRDQRRSARGDARLRHPPDGPPAAAAADRRDAPAPAPPARGQRAPGRAAGAGGLLGHAGGLAVAAHADARGGAARGRPGADGGLPRRSPACARAARADRARDGLVGARLVRGASAAEPDVGDAGSARDRDLDRVQRAPVRAPPRGAPRRVRRRGGPAAQLPAHGCRGARVGRDGDRGVRRTGAVRHQDAARLRPRDADRPERVAGGRAGRPAGGTAAPRR
jgi:hypothetical protein